MPDQTIEQRVIEIVADQLSVDKTTITPQSKFLEDLGTDSLDHVEMIMIVEEEFDIEVADEDAENLLTVGDLIAYVAKHNQ